MSTPTTTPTATTAPATPTIPSTRERYERYQQALNGELAKVEQLQTSLAAAETNVERLRGVLYALGEELKFDEESNGATTPH